MLEVWNNQLCYGNNGSGNLPVKCSSDGVSWTSLGGATDTFRSVITLLSWNNQLCAGGDLNNGKTVACYDGVIWNYHGPNSLRIIYSLVPWGQRLCAAGLGGVLCWSNNNWTYYSAGLSVGIGFDIAEWNNMLCSANGGYGIFCRN